MISIVMSLILGFCRKMNHDFLFGKL